jgi:small multidrug resistance pump
MSWLLLLAAIAFEITGTTSAKMSRGFSRLWPSLAMFACYACSMTLFNLSLKKIDVSVAYAVWAGVGITSIAIIGLFFFDEPATFWKLFFMGTTVVSVVGLSLVTRGH